MSIFEFRDIISLDVKFHREPENNKHSKAHRPSKRGKEKSPSDGHCQCKKEMDDDLLACPQIFKKCHIVTRLLKSEHHF
jgi:hypothetical protein